MTRVRLLVCAVLALGLTHGAVFAAERATDRTAATIRTALERDLCYQVYWLGREQYQRGVALPVKVLVDGDWFYARIDGLQLGPKSESWVGLYEGTVNRHGARVVKAAASPESEFWDAGVVGASKPWLREWFAERPTISLSITIPADCSPRYDLPDAVKNRMIENVVASMRRELEWSVDHPAEGLPAYPNEVHLVIGDFNVDYPYTYVLVEEPPELYRIALHDPDGSDEATYQREGKYIVGEAVTGTNLSEEDIAREKVRLTGKTRAHGIARTIVLRNDARKTSHLRGAKSPKGRTGSAPEISSTLPAKSSA